MISYFIKSSLLLILFYLIYRLFLKGEKRFYFNRLYLLAALLVSLFIPFAELSLPIEVDEETFLSVGIQTIEGIEMVQNQGEKIILEQKSQTSPLFWVYGFVSTFLLIRFLVGLLNLLFRTREKGPNISGMQVFYVSKPTSPHSFFNRLYLNKPKEQETLEEAILWHEMAHYHQRHSLDLLFIELFACVFWFHPMSWLIRKEIKSNHEYLADQKAIHKIDKEDYLQLILQYVKSKPQSLLSSSFSYSSIKTRIQMIQKPSINKKTAGFKLGMALSLSMICIGLFSFSSQKIDQQIDHQATTSFGIDLFKRPTAFPIEPEFISKISSEFGHRIHPLTKAKKLHTGVDLIAAEGTEILATGKGTVIKVAHDKKGYGNHIIVQHNMKYKTLYAHLESINVKKGEKIKQGKIIGIIGNSGTSIKTHLHYEIIEFDVKIDPQLKIDC